MARNDSEDLWELVVQLRDQVELLRAERRAQLDEVDDLRSALDATTQELKALRSTVTVSEGGPPAEEPKLPNVNVYELRPLRRR